MKRILAIVSVGFSIAVLCFSICWAAERSITLPKGTRVVKMGQGHFKFMLPDHRWVDVTGLNLKTGSFSLLQVIDQSSSRKMLWAGKQGRIINKKKQSVQVVSKGQRPNFTKTNFKEFSFPMKLTVSVEATLGSGLANSSGSDNTSDELLSDFMLLNAQDPAESSGSDNTVNDTIEEIRCESKTGCNWNTNTKNCDCP